MTSPAEDETAISSWLLAHAKVKLFSNSLIRRSLFLAVGGWGQGKKKARGTMGRGLWDFAEQTGLQSKGSTFLYSYFNSLNISSIFSAPKIPATSQPRRG